MNANIFKRIQPQRNYYKKVKGKRPGFDQFPFIYNKERILTDLPDFSNISNHFKQSLIKYKSYYKPEKIYNEVLPKNDFIDFKKMSGNEILLNLENLKFFRKTEIINALYEICHRINLPENSDVKKETIETESFKGLLEANKDTISSFKVIF